MTSLLRTLVIPWGVTWILEQGRLVWVCQGHWGGGGGQTRLADYNHCLPQVQKASAQWLGTPSHSNKVQGCFSMQLYLAPATKHQG